MVKLFKLCCALCLMVFTAAASAESIEAVGRSQIVNGDLEEARRLAVERAIEQASLFSSAQIASTQSVRNGILEIDNLRVDTLARVQNLEILSEIVRGNQLSVHIRVDLETQAGCGDQHPITAYRKPIALLQWQIQHPAQANLGGLHSLAIALPQELARALERPARLYSLDATGVRLPRLAASTSLEANYSAQISNLTDQLNTQYILLGRIESLAMAQPRSDTENVLLDNPAVDLARRKGLLDSKDLRYFSAELDLIDAASGDLLQRYRITTEGAWQLPLHKRISSIEAFYQQPYGKAVLTELSKVAQKISNSLLCEPLTANVLRTTGREVWIDRGALSGLNPGDRLSIARRVQLYDANMLPITEQVPTDLTLRLDRVEPNRAVGTLSEHSDVAKVQSGDLAIGH